MTDPAEKLYEGALALPAEDRKALAMRILKSVPRETADAIAEAWDAEVLDRLEAAERGEVEMREWDDVRRELRAKYSRA